MNLLQRGIRVWGRFIFRTARECVCALMMGCKMFLKNFPKDVAVSDLVEISMTMTQTTLWRVYEIVELEKRPLTDDERTALDCLIALYGIAGDDVRKLKERSAN